MLTNSVYSQILIVGAGGHAKVVVDAIQVIGQSIQIMIADDDLAKQGKEICELPIHTPVEQFVNSAKKFHIAIGDNWVRQKMAASLLGHGLQYQTVMHPNASVSPKANVCMGVFIAAQSVVAPHSSIASGGIINHGAVVDHDCDIGEFSHIAPNATLGGGVKIGKRVLLGAGATVLPGISIGDDCIVGAGSVVNKNLENKMIAWGVPAVVHGKVRVQ